MNNRLSLLKPHIRLMPYYFIDSDRKYHAQQGDHNALGWSPEDAYHDLIAYIKRINNE